MQFNEKQIENGIFWFDLKTISNDFYTPLFFDKRKTRFLTSVHDGNQTVCNWKQLEMSNTRK